MAAEKDHDIATIIEFCLKLIVEEGKSIGEVLAKYPDLADHLRPELEIALWLRAQRRITEPRPGFLESSRNQLKRQIQAERTFQKSRPRIRIFQKPVFRFAFAMILTLSLFLTSTGIASASALPGDIVYPVKLTWENTRLAINQDLKEEVRLHLRFADNRISEVVTLNDRINLTQGMLVFENYRFHTLGAYEILIALVDMQSPQDLVDEFSDTLSNHQLILLSIRNNVSPEVGELIDIVVKTIDADLETFRKPIGESSPDEKPVLENLEQPTNDVLSEDDTNNDAVDSQSNDIENGEQSIEGNINPEEGTGEEIPGEEGELGDQSEDQEDDGSEGEGSDDSGQDDVKDGDPEDGNQGSGNDDKEDNPNKGPGNNSGQEDVKDDDPDDGNQGGGNDEGDDDDAKDDDDADEDDD